MSSETSIKKRPGTALSIVTEFSGSGLLNPKPAAADPEELMIDQSLSPEKLELYVAFNSISDLSPVSLLEDLELLDLEENEVDDLAQLWYLGRCVKLRTLSLEGNPVSDYSYRSAVRDLIPQLILLDDVPAEEDEPQCFRTSPEDWTVLRESIKDASVSDGPELTDTDTEERSVSVSRVRPASAPPGDLRISSRSLSSRPDSARPLTSCTGSRPGSNGSDIAVLNHEASDLTNGVGRVLCGNPLQAARAQRQKIKLQNCVSQTRLSTRLSSFIPEHTYEREESSSRDHRDVFTELRRWRIEHNKRLSVIEKEQQPQVMKIHHSDDEDEGRHSHSFCSDDITRDTSSPDSSFQSPSAESPEMLRLSSSSGCSMTPSPPPRAAAAPPAGQRITQIRTRRLRAQNADVSKAKASEETHGTENIMRIIHKPHRPSSSPVASTQCDESEKTPHSDFQDETLKTKEPWRQKKRQVAPVPPSDASEKGESLHSGFSDATVKTREHQRKWRQTEPQEPPVPARSEKAECGDSIPTKQGRQKNWRQKKPQGSPEPAKSPQGAPENTVS
ncbi:leucine-rich repeat-containing 56 isoform X1 [Labeo rohita]|uniref:Leucine-rich repeat-containing 56 isoform X1 n=1 Tax=Labeo rohita TaxID=84645 RepID=A0A498LTH8_LABRO|nr:leucine-rich repeat-containing 56 isoform X1 [Labeo rohita]RXN25072.1 leucine-rich repeat-containing 56 isoform X1 [Labeo rohita]